MFLKNKNVILGITGGIAVYKSAIIASMLVKQGCNVNVIMTQNATEFITPLTFETLTSNKVVVDMFKSPEHREVEHISLAKKADLILIAPATYNIIGKIASGIADDMLSTVVSASKTKILFVPAMNTNMYENPILQENIEKLKRLNYFFMEPISGLLACKDTGKGKMPEPEDIVDYCEYVLTEKDLLNIKILITAGATIEAIDPVRFISNHSSGKMGFAIAQAAKNRGAKVTLLSSKNNLKVINDINMSYFTSVESLEKLVKENIEKNDIIIMAAAVGDYKVSEISNQKIKKDKNELQLNLVSTTDILYSIKDNSIFKTGFAAESENIDEYGLKKLKKKNLDMIVVNDISRKDIGFQSDENEVIIYAKTENSVEKIKIEKKSKKDLANDILNEQKRFFRVK